MTKDQEDTFVILCTVSLDNLKYLAKSERDIKDAINVCEVLLSFNQSTLLTSSLRTAVEKELKSWQLALTALEELQSDNNKEQSSENQPN